MKGILKCQIAGIIEDVITIDLVDVIEEVITTDMIDIIEVMLWVIGESLLVENLVHIGHLELGKTLDMIDLVVNITPSIKGKYYKLSFYDNRRRNHVTFHMVRCII